MANPFNAAELAETLTLVRSRISKHRGDRTFNEQNTKASLIVPVLRALGWDTNDSDEVHWEYKPKPKYNPVDFALLLKRTPCLFLEAKALRESLRDDRLIAQVLTYASVAGVEWVVLSNGDEYRIYNAAVLLPAEEKLFRAVSVSSDDPRAALGTLSLLSKSDLQDKKISRLWESHFVDRKVKGALEQLLDPEEPSRMLVRAIRKISEDRLRDSDIRASIRRARLHLDFPDEPEATVSIGADAAASRGPRRRVRELPAHDRHIQQFDTIVVPARQEGFRDTFMAENRWYKIKIHGAMRPQIRHIAVYRVAPISAITHIAPVRSVEPWEGSEKCVVNFAEPASEIGPIQCVKGGRVKHIQSARYTTRAKLMAAKTLEDVW